MTPFSLHPFPGQNSGGVNIHGAIERTNRAILLSFLLQGNLCDLVLPTAAEPKRCDNLWQSTCLELFWAEEGGKNYWELNLAPTGDWNVYAFTDYRTGMHQEDRVAGPLTETHRTEDSFSLTGELKITNLHGGHTPLRVGISAVLQHRNNRLSYWALAHPEEKPDFHAPRTFLLQL
ncbi:MAG: DOMON-like domain-containing protein [Desulfobulbaceae bacterium]|nr:DOMON-like domain-containing protein [Desulfobulbaceae bacterium]HIJ90383.1 DOMON-like domain-containing protein [Deltaproteobacteria bacterium]